MKFQRTSWSQVFLHIFRPFHDRRHSLKIIFVLRATLKLNRNAMIVARRWIGIFDRARNTFIDVKWSTRCVICSIYGGIPYAVAGTTTQSEAIKMRNAKNSHKCHNNVSIAIGIFSILNNKNFRQWRFQLRYTQKNKTPLRFRCLHTAAIPLVLLIIIYECFVLITRYRSCFSWRVRFWFTFNLLDLLVWYFRGIQDNSRSSRSPSFRLVYFARRTPTTVCRAEDAFNWRWNEMQLEFIYSYE